MKVPKTTTETTETTTVLVVLVAIVVVVAFIVHILTMVAVPTMVAANSHPPWLDFDAFAKSSKDDKNLFHEYLMLIFC